MHLEYVCIDCKHTRTFKKRNNINNFPKIFFNIYCESVKSENENSCNRISSDIESDRADELENDIEKLNRKLAKNINESEFSLDSDNYQWHCLDYMENMDGMSSAISKFLNFKE